MSDEARYILAKKIARGGMAEIFLGKHIGEDGFQRLCAIKRILPHYAADQEFVQMFRDEAHICKRLQHANIVRVEGFEEVEGSYAIIMEFVDGVDLRTLLHVVEQAKKKVAVPIACFTIAEAARGLHYAHTKVDEITQQALGIVHRDVSPQNILVSFEGEVKITDFGIADAESKMTETRPGIVKGKYSYMSPEQIAAKPVDCRTDIFALSIVLWEMLAMRRLFQGENEVDTIQRVKNCRIDLDLRQLNPDVDEDLDNIIKKGLARDPRKRFKTAADFEKELRRYMSRKFPEFTPEDIGNFLKLNMEARRVESAAEIKRTLTDTSQRPRASVGKKRTPEVDPEPPVKSSPQLSLARQGSVGTPGRGGGNTSLPVSSVSSLTRHPSAMNRGAPAKNHATNPANFPQAHVRRQGGMGKPLGVLAAAFVVIVAALAYLAPNSAKKADARAPQMLLLSEPSRVRVSIDGKFINHGNYVHGTKKKPVGLTKLSPGEHALIVSRYGYVPYRTTIKIEDGEHIIKDDIVLRAKGPLAAVKIHMKPGTKGAKIDINSGYFVADLGQENMGTVAPEVLINHHYTMRVLSDDDKEEFSCRFVPNTSNWGAPNEVVIDRKAKHCQFTNQ